MYDRVSIDDLVCFGGFPPEVSYAVQQAALAHPKGREALYRTPHLDPRTWQALWTPRLPVEAAAALVARCLTPDQVDAVLERESRVRVLSSLLEHNELTEQQLLTAFSTSCAGGLVPLLLEQESLPSQWRKELLSRSRPDALAESMLFEAGLFSDNEVMKFLAALPPKGWRSYQDRSLLIQGLFFTRPEVLSRTVRELATDSAPFTTAAGSPMLGEEIALLLAHRATESTQVAVGARFALLALIHNPVADPSLVGALRLACEGWSAHAGLEDIVPACDHRLKRPLSRVLHTSAATSEELEWLIRRAAPRDYPSRPLELLLLLENPQLPEESREYLFQVAWRDIPARWETLASESVSRELQSRSASRAASATPHGVSAGEFPPARAALLESAAAELGDSEKSWENLVLLMDDFSGSFSGLVQAASCL